MAEFKKIYEKLWTRVTGAQTSTATMIGGLCREHSVYVEWGTGVTAGVVVLESAAYSEYTGTWATIQTFTWAAAGKQEQWRGTGAFGALRLRTTTDIAGGDGVSAWLVAN